MDMRCRLLAGIGALTFAGAGMAANLEYQTTGVTKDNLPAIAAQLKQKMSPVQGWSPAVKDMAAWRKAGRAKAWELTWQAPDATPFDMQVISEVDRGSYVARKLIFNLTAESRVAGLLLVPKGKGPFPAAVMYHDHGSKFDIGKEKWIEPWNDDAKLASAQGWAKKFFTERFPGDELARRGYVVFATDALGWGDRAGMTYEAQQALAANMFNMGSSLAGLMALEDTRAAEFVASLPEVNKKQVAAIGFSMGAFRAWQAAALTDAVTASVAVNWMATGEGLMVPGNNQLRGGSAWQMLHPGMLHFLDYPDVAGLAAPKPMLIYAGEKDVLFPMDSVKQAFARMEGIWGAWKAGDRFESKVWPGGHVFEAPQQDYAYDWLDKQFGIKR